MKTTELNQIINNTKQIINNAKQQALREGCNQIIYLDEFANSLSFSRDYEANNMYKQCNVIGYIKLEYKNQIRIAKYKAK